MKEKVVIIVQFWVSFIFLFGFWLIWSGKVDPFHLTLGVISTLIVATWSGHLLVQDKAKSAGQLIKELCRFELYSVWLFIEIVKANIYVFWVALHPDMKTIINPRMVEFKTKLKGDVPIFLLAQSITLTPGTISVRISDQTVLVHALTDTVAEGVPGDMEPKIERIFRKGA